MGRFGRPSQATVVAYLALFLALGLGGAWAADKVRSKQIAKNAVRAKHIKRNQVRAQEIAGGAVGERHLADDSIAARHVRDGAIGPAALSADYLEAERVLHGRAPTSDDETLLFEWPGAGVEVRTGDEDAADSLFQFRLRNTNGAGGPSYWVSTGSAASSLDPGDSEVYGDLLGAELLLVENKGSTGRMMRLHCFANVLSGGDDDFMQCMGITAGG